jgi:hypothetical protein
MTAFAAAVATFFEQLACAVQIVKGKYIGLTHRILRHHDGKFPLDGTLSSPTTPKVMVVKAGEPLREHLACCA